MKKILRFLMVIAVLSAVIVPLVPQQATAQTSVTSTILSAALGQTDTTMYVASATGFTASSGTATYYAYIDRELVGIRAVSGTTITITRGQQQTKAMPHRVSSVVFVGPAVAFAQSDPGSGQCTLQTSQQYTPVINIVNGNVWNCSQLRTAAQSSAGSGISGNATGLWQASNLLGVGYSMPYTTVTDVAYTIKMSDTFVDYNSITTSRTATLPAITGVYGKVVIVKHSGATATLTIAASAGQYVGTIGTSSIGITHDQALKLISVGNGWVTTGAP